MEKIPLGIAKKILQLLNGEAIPYSQLKNKVITKIMGEGVLQIRIQGRSRQQVYIAKPDQFRSYLSNNWGINDLRVYIHNLEQGNSRTENILASSDSKISSKRTFKGFLVNCAVPIKTEINGANLLLQPLEGTFTFIHDFESFNIPKETLVIGVENSENFRHLQKQTYLFETSSPMFVSRYPQSKDLVNWLKDIPNPYLHYGDFDFEGIRIFRDEFHRYLGERASFFIPKNIEVLLERFGNKSIYNKQFKSHWKFSLDNEIDDLIALFHKYKKCLEQEVFITSENTEPFNIHHR